jgi:hypothetical protein
MDVPFIEQVSLEHLAENAGISRLKAITLPEREG